MRKLLAAIALVAYGCGGSISEPLFIDGREILKPSSSGTGDCHVFDTRSGGEVTLSKPTGDRFQATIDMYLQGCKRSSAHRDNAWSDLVVRVCARVSDLQFPPEYAPFFYFGAPTERSLAEVARRALRTFADRHPSLVVKTDKPLKFHEYLDAQGRLLTRAYMSDPLSAAAYFCYGQRAKVSEGREVTRFPRE